MSYEFYKVLHYAFIFLSLMLITLSFAVPDTRKSYKIGLGISTLLIFVAGMGLIARIGISHGEGFPGWIWVKIILWLVITISAPITIKRFKHKRPVLLPLFYSFFLVAAIVAVFRT